MGQKKRNTYQLNWQATDPAPFSPNTPATGVLTGAMASTNTIYSNIQDISNADNVALEVTFTGTPTGVLSVKASESGNIFYSLTFDPALAQPAGSAGGYMIDLNQCPFRYIHMEYVNSSGSGTLTVVCGSKDLN